MADPGGRSLQRGAGAESTLGAAVHVPSLMVQSISQWFLEGARWAVPNVAEGGLNWRIVRTCVSCRLHMGHGQRLAHFQGDRTRHSSGERGAFQNVVKSG